MGCNNLELEAGNRKQKTDKGKQIDHGLGLGSQAEAPTLGEIYAATLRDRLSKALLRDGSISRSFHLCEGSLLNPPPLHEDWVLAAGARKGKVDEGGHAGVDGLR